MFEDFDFSLLDREDYKEDAVREDIVAPILRRLGFRPSGQDRMDRSKNLPHPYVMIGSKRYPVYIVPDYTLFSGGKPVCIIDAKRPSEEVTRSKNVEQAYSYAIHPDIRVETYGLHNGRELVLFSTGSLEPILRVPLRETDDRWADIERFLSPLSLREPIRRQFRPDLGLHFYKLRGPPDGSANDIFPLEGISFPLIARVSDDLYAGQCFLRMETTDFLATFDFVPSQLRGILSGVPPKVSRSVLSALSRAPYRISMDREIVFDLVSILGNPTKGQHDMFVPFNVLGFANSRYTGALLNAPKSADVWELSKLMAEGE